MGGGVAVFDFNQDGWEDSWINDDGYRDVFITTREDAPNLLLKNKGNGTFYNPNKNTIFLTVLDALGNTIIQ